MRIKEMTAKVLDKDTSLAIKIWMLFREQSVMIPSMLMAIGMTIGVLVKVLLQERMAQEQTESLGITARKIRRESDRSIAWHHWSNHQLDPQQSKRGSGLGIAKSMGIGRRHRMVALYVCGHQKIRIILRHIVI